MTTPTPPTVPAPLAPPAVPTVPAPAAWKRRDVRWCAAAALVIVAVTATLLAVTGRDATAVAAPGDVVQSSVEWPSSVTEHRSELRVPFGQVDVTVTDPVTSTGDVSELDGRSAPEGGSFVGVEVASDRSKTLPVTSAKAGIATADVTVALVVGDRRYPVPPDALDQRIRFDFLPEIEQRRAWVAVPGTPRDTRVEITFDGVTQSVDPRTQRRTTGRAAALYTLPFVNFADRPRTDCRFDSLPAGYSQRPDYGNTCTLSLLGRLPWTPGAGWAPDGSAWLVALVGIDSRARFTWRGDGRSVDLRSVTKDEPDVTVDVAGRSVTPAPLPAGTGVQVPGVDDVLVVVARVEADAGATALTVRATWHDVSTYGPAPAGAPVSPDITQTWTVTP